MVTFMYINEQQRGKHLAQHTHIGRLPFAKADKDICASCQQLLENTAIPSEKH